MRSSFRLVAAALSLALCGTLSTSTDAAPNARTGAQPSATRRARNEVPAALRPSRRATEGIGPNDKKTPAEKVEKKQESKPQAVEKKPSEPSKPAESVGPPNDGRLEGGIKLDTTKAYLRVMPAYVYGSRDTRWGLPALVHAIDRAAKAVNKKYPGAVLGVGDISRKGGGELANHHSHESGRDADLGFYLVDSKGQPVLKQSFLKVDEKLTATDVPGAKFDVGRNWLLLQNLLLDREARVSHIFVSEPIKHALLAHARSRGVARALYVRAAQVMMQPTGGLPHDDHFHIRISCPSSPKKSCVEIAKNAPSKARHKMAKKGRSGMKTPARRAATPKAAPKPTADTTPTKGRSGGIYLQRTAKNEGGPDVPVSLWALAGASLGAQDDQPAKREEKREETNDGEAESDAVDVKDAIDEGGAVRITQ